MITTPNFANYTNIPLVSDFTITNPIPMSYLAAGQLRFTDDSGTKYWLLSWGGSAFTGPMIGEMFHQNDADGNFGPPAATALPSNSLQALQFTGTSTALSTNNLAQYAVTTGAATFVNNAGTSFTLVAPPTFDAGDFDEDGQVDDDDLGVWQDNFGLVGTATHQDGDADDDDDVDGADYLNWQEQATVAGVPAISDAPEPAAALLATIAALGGMRWRRRSRRAWPAG